MCSLDHFITNHPWFTMMVLFILWGLTGPRVVHVRPPESAIPPKKDA